MEQTIAIVNPPDNIYVGVCRASVILRSWNESFKAVHVVFNTFGVVQVQVPRSRTCKLWKHEICDTLLVSGTS